MSELEIVSVMLVIALGVSAYFCWRWQVALDEIKWKSVQLENLESARAHFKRGRDDMVAETRVFMQYAHVRAIVANIKNGKARKK